MIRLAPVALATLLAASVPPYLHAQTPFTPLQLTSPFTDPANLRGERVSPRTGRELPIDGGQGDNVLGLQQLLRKLNTRASILNIVAHPDDEDGGMLTLYSRGYGARVADLSLTRGEGGQNAMTGDFEDALGLLRTQELLANDRYTGVTQMFGTEVDFGFSKTKAESFSKWNHQRVLYDAVRAIRLYRPLVITATFIGNPTDGHGQHQVSGEIAQEAFLAAGDPNVFPELTKEGILPWQPLKMYARVPTYAFSDKGLFDYATGQYVPAAFTNYVTGVTSSTPPSTDIVIHEGAADPLITTCAANPADLPPQLKPASTTTPDCRPLTYVQFARIGLGLQRSQIGPGVRNAPSGRFDVPYHLYGSRMQAPTARSITAQGNALGTQSNKEQRAEGPLYNPALAPQSSFFDGIDTSIEGIATLAPDLPMSFRAGLKDLGSSISRASSVFEATRSQDSPQGRDMVAIVLADALKHADALISGIEAAPLSPIEKANVLHELRIKRVQLNDALALSYGIKFDASATSYDHLYAHTPAIIEIQASASDQAGCSLNQAWLENSTGQISEETRGVPLHATALLTKSVNETLVATNPRNPFATEFTGTVTRPYFERDSIEDPVYKLLDPSLRNAAQSPPALTGWASIQCGLATLTVGHTAHFAYQDKQPINIVPTLDVSLSPHASVLPQEQRSITATVTDQSFRSRAYLEGLCLPTGCMNRFKQAADGTRTYHIDIPQNLRSAAFTVTTYGFSADLHPSEVTNLIGHRSVGYPGLVYTNFYTPATDRIVPVDLKLPPPNKRRIGYLEGTGDAVPAALASIGLKPTLLTVADLTPEKLSHFDTVILGVRTYNAHPDLHGAPTQALLDFARNGGNVLVQYQTREFTAADAPFPLSLGSDEKVVDETDPVEILHPQSTLFTTPNHIVTSDFDHWIEERGHGFLGSWDPRYSALTETHDPGQAPQKGGLITVQLGRGRWTYCAFALYRQLPEAVPGTFRLFTNLLNP